jgi:hypothetical protein
MGDYTQQVWVDDDGSGAVGTVYTQARMDHIEAGIKDAAEHNRIRPISTRARPPQRRTRTGFG